VTEREEGSRLRFLADGRGRWFAFVPHYKRFDIGMRARAVPMYRDAHYRIVFVREGANTRPAVTDVRSPAYRGAKGKMKMLASGGLSLSALYRLMENVHCDFSCVFKCFMTLNIYFNFVVLYR